jgi:hypothetical protein
MWINEEIKEINAELKNKWNVMASKAVTDMVIKKNHLIGNRTPAACTVGKHATNWTIANNVRMPTFMRLMK